MTRRRIAVATSPHARRAQILGEAALGLAALGRWRLAGRRGRPYPRASAWWVPLHSLLGRRGLVGATTPEERAFCEWYARLAYQGRGAIVDLGSWLGSTTVPLARGMTQRRPSAPRTTIHAYDRFVWEDWMTEFAASANANLAYRPGDDFRPTLERALGDYPVAVEIHAADLCVERWTGGPIELAVVDAMKSWDLARNILQEFLAAVVVDGVVFHQDFAHHYTPWIHVIGYRLRDHFEVYYDVPYSDAVAFRVRSPLIGIDARELASPAAYGPDEVSAAFEHSRRLVRSDKHANVTAAEAMFHVHTGDLERASSVLRRARALGLRGDLHAAERWLREAQAEATE